MSLESKNKSGALVFLRIFNFYLAMKFFAKLFTNVQAQAYSTCVRTLISFSLEFA